MLSLTTTEAYKTSAKTETNSLAFTFINMPYQRRHLISWLFLGYTIGAGAVAAAGSSDDLGSLHAYKQQPIVPDSKSYDQFGKHAKSSAVDPAWSSLDTTSQCGQLLLRFARPMPFAIIGHFTHSLTLRDLRRYFDPNATAVNYVPTINRDTKSDTPLLLHAPQFPELDGDTEAMKTLDMVLSHMDDKNWDIKGYTTLERVAHAFHMEAVWAKAKTYFDEMQRSPAPPSPQLCDCVMDVDNNGILKFLRYSALEIREPQLIYSRQLTDFGPNAPPKDYDNYQKGRKKRSVDTGLKNGPQNLLADSNAAGIHLKDEAAWKKWKEEVPSEDMHYNNALFMYCAVQKAHKHH